MKYPEWLTRFEFDGVTYGSMHKLAVPIFTDLFAKLVPLIPGGLVAGQCGCYNPGSVTVGGDRSFHTYAIATDTNWGYNPMYRRNRPTGKHTLPAKTSSIAHSMGCEWGGDWSYPQDWMHIEVHLSPDECRTYARTRKQNTTPVIAKPATPDPEEFTLNADDKKYLDAKFANLAHQHDVIAKIAADAKHSADAAQAKIDAVQKRLDAPKPSK